MNKLDFSEILVKINTGMIVYNDRRLEFLKKITFDGLLNNNAYLMAVMELYSAEEIIAKLLDNCLISAEEVFINDFLKDLAIFIASQTCNGYKSTAPGVDLEFFNRDVHYIVSVKSGWNWGNSSQQRKLEEDLRNAAARLKQAHRSANVQTVLGICYGKSKTTYLRGYLKISGQNFWYLISENMDLYTDIIEPIGFRAKEHNEAFILEKAQVQNRFTKSFIDRFCDEKGGIDWVKLVEYNSGNFDLDQFLV